jgi:hypothetical protein
LQSFHALEFQKPVNALAAGTNVTIKGLFKRREKFVACCATPFRKNPIVVYGVYFTAIWSILLSFGLS